MKGILYASVLLILSGCFRQIKLEKPSPIIKFKMNCEILAYDAKQQPTIMSCGDNGIWNREGQHGNR